MGILEADVMAAIMENTERAASPIIYPIDSAHKAAIDKIVVAWDKLIDKVELSKVLEKIIPCELDKGLQYLLGKLYKDKKTIPICILCNIFIYNPKSGVRSGFMIDEKMSPLHFAIEHLNVEHFQYWHHFGARMDERAYRLLHTQHMAYKYTYNNILRFHNEAVGQKRQELDPVLEYAREKFMKTIYIAYLLAEDIDMAREHCTITNTMDKYATCDNDFAKVLFMIEHMQIKEAYEYIRKNKKSYCHDRAKTRYTVFLAHCAQINIEISQGVLKHFSLDETNHRDILRFFGRNARYQELLLKMISIEHKLNQQEDTPQ